MSHNTYELLVQELNYNSQGAFQQQSASRNITALKGSRVQRSCSGHNLVKNGLRNDPQQKILVVI